MDTDKKEFWICIIETFWELSNNLANLLNEDGAMEKFANLLNEARAMEKLCDSAINDRDKWKATSLSNDEKFEARYKRLVLKISHFYEGILKAIKWFENNKTESLTETDVIAFLENLMLELAGNKSELEKERDNYQNQLDNHVCSVNCQESCCLDDCQELQEELSAEEKEVLYLIREPHKLDLTNKELDSKIRRHREKLLRYLEKNISELKKRIEEKIDKELGIIVRFAIDIIYKKNLSIQTLTPQPPTKEECKNCPIKETKVAKSEKKVEEIREELKKAKQETELYKEKSKKFETMLKLTEEELESIVGE